MAEKPQLLQKRAELRKQYIGAGMDLVIGEKLDTLTRAIKKQKLLHDAACKRALEAQISETRQKKATRRKTSTQQ
eukprot:6446946-Pyramimonas_sp.AAC.1